MDLTIKKARTQLEMKKGEKQNVLRDISSLKQSIKQTKRLQERHKEALEVIRIVGEKTQQKMQYHISDITSLALEAIFDDPYQLQLVFEKKRDKTECRIVFKRGEMEVSPLDASGGGAVDIAAFALRIASWSMKNPRTRPFIILDEPMKNLSIEYRDAASQMLKDVSSKLNIQFLIVTHDPILSKYGDKVFEFKKVGNKTIVK